MHQLVRIRLTVFVAAALLALTAGLPTVDARSAPATAGPALTPTSIATRSPFEALGIRAGNRYGSSRAGVGATTQALDARLGPKAGSGPASAPAARSTAPALRPDGAPPAPVAATQTSAPDNHASGFAGLGAADQASPTTEPADSSVAVGPDEIVQVAGFKLRITDRSGTPVQADRTIPSLFLLPTGFFDREPRVVYDSLHGRFVATELSWDCTPDSSATFGHGYIDLAVSETTDPAGTWDLYFWGYNDLVPEDPSIGTSTDKLAISSDLYAMSQAGGGGSACADPASLSANPYGGDVLIANWADAVAHKTSTLPSSEFVAHDDSTDPAGPTAVGIRAALQEPATSATLFVLARSVVDDPAQNLQPNDVVVTTFIGTTTKTVSVGVAGSWSLTGDGVVAPFVTPPPPAPHQPGSPATIVDAGGVDAQDALWQASELTWTTTYPCIPAGDSSTRDCVRVSQVTTPASASVEPATSQDFTIGRNGFDSYLPGIGLAGDGTLEIVYSQSNASGSNYPSSYQQYQRPTDSANHVSPPVRLAAGTGTYPGTAWGTYVGLAQDPQVASAVWQANEYSVGSGYWATFVDRLGTPTGTTYTPITPIRVLDSRDGTGLPGHTAAKFVSSAPRSFPVAGVTIDSVTIPPNAVAVTGNVTVTRQNAAGFVAVTPTALSNPPSSTLNFPLGDTRANNVTVPLSSQGTLSMTYKATAAKTTDLVFDVTGYFLPDDSAATYHPVSPTRLLNSVTGIGQPGGAPARFVAGVPQTFTIGGAPIPSGATAITGNLTVTNQTKAGFLAVTPTPTSTPGSSNLNFPLADNRANGFTAPLNGNQLSIVYMAVTGATTDVILDVTGYYLDDLSGLHFFPLTPGRLLDSRTGAADSGLTGLFASSVPRSLPTSGHWGVPTSAQAVTGNLTVVNQTTRGYAAITPDPDPNPTTSTLNFPLGDIRANGVTVPLNGSGAMALVYKGTSSGARTNLIFDVSGYFQ